MPTSSSSNVTPKENPPKAPPKSSAATAKEDRKPATAAAAAGRGDMGTRLSTTPGSAGKAPSTASASSTHTASTMPADGAESKAKSKSGGGVAGFLRRKPSSKEPAAGPSSGAAPKRDTKKGMGSSLRTSLFKRSTKSKNGGDTSVVTAGSEDQSSSSSSTSAAANSGDAKTSGTALSAKTPSRVLTSTEKGRTSPAKGRVSPEKGQASPEKRRASTDKSPADGRGASPPKSQRFSSGTETSPADPTKKSVSPRPGGTSTAGRSNQALTPELKETLKKQWFTDGKPLPVPTGRGRATGRTGTAAGVVPRSEPRSRPGPGETVGPPATASRVSGSAFSAAAAKFGGVKASTKPLPGSPKKVDKSQTSPKKTRVSGSPKKAGGATESPKKAEEATENLKEAGGAPRSPKKSDGRAKSSYKSDVFTKSAAMKGLGDLMDSVTGFQAEEISKPKDVSAKGHKNIKADDEPSNKDEPGTSLISTSVNAKADKKVSGSGDDLDDLMGFAEGFNTGGSQTDKLKTRKTNDGSALPKRQDDGYKKAEDKPVNKPSVDNVSKTVEEKCDRKDSQNGKTGVEKQGLKDVTMKPEREKEEKNDIKSRTHVSDIAKGDCATSGHKPSANDALVKEPPGDALEPEADKMTTWRHGDTEGGELGLGGISQKDRQERAQRPSAPKDQTVDLDSLMGQIDTKPKPKTEESPKGQKRKSTDKDACLGGLMDLTKGFDMSEVGKSEPVVATSSTAPELAPSDMDKLLDMMDAAPAKPTTAAAMPPVEEEERVKRDTWRTGDGDDEMMIALMKKPRDKHALSQAPDWDIDDLLVSKVVKSETSEDMPAPEKKACDRKTDGGDFFGFNDFIGESLSGNAFNVKDNKLTDEINPPADIDDMESKKASEKTFAGFDKSISAPLPGKESAYAGNSGNVTEKPAENVADNIIPAGDDFATFADFLSGSDKTTNKIAEKELANKETVLGEFSSFDDFMSSSLTGKESAKGPPTEESVAVPKKVSTMDTAPPARAEEEVIAAVACSHTTAVPRATLDKSLSEKVSKESDTRGIVPDHGHNVRDLLYDESDKAGTKPSVPCQDPKFREPAILDDLIRPTKAAVTKEEMVEAQTASTTEAGKPSGMVSDEHREKPGNTRGSVPDHGHGVRDVLYDDRDKTGRKKSGSKESSNSREPAPVEGLIQPKKALKSQAAQDEGHTPSSGEDVEEEEKETVSTETPHQTQASGQADSKKKRRPRKRKKQAKEGDTRGSVPDHGHGVRNVLYDESDETGRKGTSSESKGYEKAHEPAALDDLIQPKKVAASHSTPAARSPCPESKQTEEVVTAQTTHMDHAATPVSGKKASKKNQAKEGDTRGSVPDQGHGVRDVLYDDKDNTGRGKLECKEEFKPREPAPLDDLIKPKKAAVADSAVPARKSYSRSPSPDEEDDDEISAESVHQTQVSGQTGGKKKRRPRKKKKQAKEGDTRGSVLDHGHDVRDVLYDDSDKTGRKKTDTKQGSQVRDLGLLDTLIRPAQATHTASAPPAGSDSSAVSPAGPEQTPVAEKTGSVQSTPPAAAAPASPKHQEPARRGLSLAGLTDPDQEDSDDGEQLRQLIASTEALQAQLHSTSQGDSKQAQAVREQSCEELERLERSLEYRQQRLETAGRCQQVQAARRALQKVKQQLDVSRASNAATH